MFAHPARTSIPARVPFRRGCLSISILLLAALAGCVTPTPPPPAPQPTPVIEAPPEPLPEPVVLETKTGLASYYHPSLHGLETASGMPYDDTALMAAHPSYPLGTAVRVTNLENDASVEVDITDRGPTEDNVAEGVIIDLSGAAAKTLGMMEDGRVRVKVEVIYWGADERTREPQPIADGS
jgi:rare lipoprotein A